MIFVGLDLHKRYITACALDADGAVLAAARRLPADWPALAAWLALLPPPRTVVLESCLYCWWLERQLTANSDTALVVDPHQVKLISQARAKTDPIDAFKLADLARAHVLPALWVPDLATRARRQALRGRSFLVRQRTVFKNRVHAYLTAENLHCPVTDLYGKGGRAWLEALELPRVVRVHVTLLLTTIDQLTTQLRALDRDLSRTIAHDAISQRLQTIPGVGPLGALILQAEIGPLTRFRDAAHLAAYAGLTPSTRSSGGKTRHGAVGRGNPWLKWIVIEILQHLKLAPGPPWARTIRRCCDRRANRRPRWRRRANSARICTGCSRKTSPTLNGFVSMTVRGCARCNRWALRRRREPTSRAR